MRKHQLIITALAWVSCAAVGLAEPSLDALRKQVKELREQEKSLTKQQVEVKKKLNSMSRELTIAENEPEFTAAVAAMKVQKPAKPRKVLVYSRTKGYRHKSIPYGIYTLTELGKRTGAFTVVASEDPGKREKHARTALREGGWGENTSSVNTKGRLKVKLIIYLPLVDSPLAGLIPCHSTHPSRPPISSDSRVDES